MGSNDPREVGGLRMKKRGRKAFKYLNCAIAPCQESRAGLCSSKENGREREDRTLSDANWTLMVESDSGNERESALERNCFRCGECNGEGNANSHFGISKTVALTHRVVSPCVDRSRLTSSERERERYYKRRKIRVRIQTTNRQILYPRKAKVHFQLEKGC